MPVPVVDAAEEAVPLLLPPAAPAAEFEVVPVRREAVDPRVGERRAGGSLGRRDPDRPVTPAILVIAK